jgi:hypothetical protein
LANAATGSLAVQNGAALSATTLTNAGAVTVGSNSTLFVPSYTQTGGSTAVAGRLVGQFFPPVSTGLLFNGSSSYVDAGNAAVFNAPFTGLTLEAWVKPSASVSGLQLLIGKWATSPGSQNQFALFLINNRLELDIADGNGSDNFVVGNTTLAAGTWYHVAGVWSKGSPGQYSVYVNGVLDGTAQLGGTINTQATTTLKFGRQVSTQDRPFNGQMAEVRFWGAARSQQQIQANMLTTLTGSEAGLVGYWRLDDGSGITAIDRTANQDHGVLGAGVAVNQPAWVTLTPPAVSLQLQGGTLSGTGTLATNVSNTGGTVSPGTNGTAGTLTVTGTYTQSAAATLNVDLGGTTAGSQYDQLLVYGAAALDGTLKIAEINGFAPANGNTFQVVASGSLSGTFATTNGLVGPQVHLQANYGANGVTLVSQRPGIEVSPTTGLQTSQAGASATFSVVLDVKPSADVTIGLSSSNTNAGVVSTSQLVFTPQNWNTPQTVTVTGVNDFVDEGDQVYTIATAPAVSSDPVYNGFDPSDVTVTNVGTIHAGFAVTPTTGLQTSQAGATASFTVALTSRPLADVTFALISSNTNAGTVSPSSLTFTAQNWNTPQPVVVTGVNDHLADGDVAYTIITQPAVSADPKYNQLDPPDVSVTNLGTNLLDLQLANLAVTPSSNLQSGDTVTVSWQDSVTGNISTPQGFYDNVTVQNLTTGATLVNAQVYYDPNAAGNGSIQPGQSRGRQYSFALPNGAAGTGQIQVTVTTNSTRAIHESDSSSTADTNNTASVTVSSALAPYPDLQVTGLTAIPATGLQSGNTITLQWNDTNTGGASTGSANWVDAVVATNLTTGSTLFSAVVPGGNSLGAGQSRAEQDAFPLPDGSAGVGQIQFTVTANATNTVFENNAVGTATLTESSALAPYPDLQVANLTLTPADAASGLQSGAAVSVSWDDQNTGNGDTTDNGTRRGSFFDYLTVQRVDGSGAVLDTLISTLLASGSLAAGASGHQQYAFRLPDGARGVGNLLVTVTTDYSNQVFEYNAGSTAKTNNTSSLKATVAPAAYPDLQVTNLALSSTSGQPLQSGGGLTVTWDDSNTGNAPASGEFFDHVTIVNAMTGQTLTATDVLYDPAAAGNGAIAAQDARPRQFVFTLPQGTPGTGNLQVTVTTNYYNQVFEYNTAGPGGTSTAQSNNTASVTTTSALAPYADLATSAVTAPALTVGDPAQVTIGWTVTNQGGAATNVGAWVDAILLSPDDNPAHGTVLEQFPHQGALAPGGNYTQSQTFLLPRGFQTHSHLFVQTDAAGAAFENGNVANNYGEAPNFFDVVPMPYADLAVSSVSADAMASSGRPIHVSWTVANQSPHAIGTTNLNDWADSVYLATDPAGKNNVASLGSFDHIGALAVGGNYTHTVSATLPADLSGTYYVVVKTGGPFEFIYTDNDSAVSGPVTVTLTPAPDLTTTQLKATFPDSTAELTAANAGDKIDVTWTVANVGAGDANGTWYDSLHLKEVGGSGRDFGLSLFDYSTPLPAGQAYSRSEQVQLPANVQGVFQLVLKANSGTELVPPIFENGAYANNTLTDPDTLTVSVPANPDLQVSSIDDVPQSANAGGTVGFDFTVINQGTVEARGQWTDNVYLSLKNSLDGNAILLGQFGNQSALLPGEKYQTQTGGLVLPKRLSGPAYLIVYTNANGTINEYPNGNNDTLVQSITINPEPPADLVTSNVVAPDQTFDGTTIPVTYHVSNLGLGPTDPGSWTDTIWLTHDRTRPNPTKGDILLATIPHTGVLGNDPTVISPPTGYDVTTNVTLPRHISGQFYITPWSDSFDVVLKSTQDANVNPDDPTQLNSDNYKARPITVLLTPPPDLVVTNISPQPIGVGGENYTVNWTVKNQGASPTEDAILFDQVYLSDKPTFVPPDTGQDTGNQWSLGTIEHDGAVPAGGGYTAQQTFALAPDISGKYVIVVTNTGGFVIDPSLDPALAIEIGTHYAPTWEGPYTDNNVTAAATLVTPRPPADLQVTSVVTQAPNYSGEPTTVTYTVTNKGADVWSGTRYWTDKVYFSKYPTLDLQHDPQVATVLHSNAQPLAAGASYTQSTTFALPPGIGGTSADPQTFYVYVITDPDGSLSSGSHDNGNSFGIRAYEVPGNNEGGQTLPVIYREPDLVVSNVIVPTTTPHAGDTIPITWTVTNQGNRDTRQKYWIDRVFLSPDPSLHNDDTELGQLAHEDILKAGDSYTATLNVPLPYGIGGNYYLLVFTDATAQGSIDVPGLFSGADRVPEFQGEGNNITAALMPVDPTRPPHLQVASVTAVGPDPTLPDHVLTGQPFTVTYTVTNSGGDTPDRQSTWSDAIYLSRDQLLDDADVYFTSEEHKGGLKAGASYTNTVTLQAPRGMTGPWYVFVISNPPTGNSPIGSVYEGGGANQINDTPTTTPLIIDEPPPADLVVTAVTVPASAMSGDPVQIQWTVENVGTNPASGTWSDRAYLSPGATWSIDDTPIGDRFTYSGTLQPGQSYTATLNANLPPATPGSYRVIVRTNIFGDIIESNERNNTTASADVLDVTVPALQLGVPFADTLDSGEDRLYQVTVPDGDTLRVDLTSSDSSAADELFLRYNALPSASTYDAAYQGALQANQFAVIPSTHGGVYYVLVHGQSEPAAQTPITLLASVLPFEITDVIPDTGGDSRYVTTTILGAQFDPQAIVKLERPGFAEFEPASYQVVDRTRIIAVFDLTGAPHGLYDVEVINPDGEVALAPYRYLVEQALPPDVSIALGGPRVVWAGQGGLYGLTLTSRTNVDLPYVYLQYGVPGLPSNGGVPYLGLTTNLSGNPDVAGVPWASIVPTADTNGQFLASGYALDLADQSSDTLSFKVQTYPGGLPPGAYSDNPGVTAFAFNIMAAATPLTRDEYVAQQTQFAATLRANILKDPTASPALQALAADPTNWTDLYLQALTQAGLLRPEDQPPAVHDNPVLVSLQTTLAAGILAGPAGKQIITDGNLVDFFNQVKTWYGDDPGKISPYVGIATDTTSSDDSTTYLEASPPPASGFNLNQSARTHYEGFNVYVPWSNDWDNASEDDFVGDSDQTNPQNASYVNVQAPNFAPFFTGTGRSGQATLNGPLGYGPEQFVPVGQPLPFTIQFENGAGASSTVGEVRVVEQLDPNLDPHSFRLGDLQLGDLQVHIPGSVGSFQGDFDFTQSKGFILRVSAGLDVTTNTATWLLQAIDPNTGEVITDPSKGLLPPDNSAGAGRGFVTYTAQPIAGLATGTPVSAQARVLFNTTAPLDTPTITYTIDGTAPTTTLTASPVTAGSSDYNVQWDSQDDPAGSGVKGVTVYVSQDGGPWKIWLDQTTASSGIYNGQAGHSYHFLALATDNAGNQERPPLGTAVPSDDSQANLGTLPTVSGTSQDLGTPPPPATTPSTNALFTQAQQGIPSPTPPSRPAEFKSVLAPFVAQSFATGIGQSQPGIGPVALLPLPDGRVLASGGPGRNQLFLFTAAGGQAGSPVATLAEPVYDMARDSSGDLWATTGGGPLLELDPSTFAVIGQFGDSLTQSLAIQPGTGLIYVSSGNGIEVFDPATQKFSHFSDIRVGSLAFAPDGTLWAATWPHNQGQVVRFDLTRPQAGPQLMFTFAADVDSLAFGVLGSKLDGLLFISHTDQSVPGAGSELTMIDLATLQQVAVATGGTRGDEIKTTADGRLLLSQSHQIDVLGPVVAPRVAAVSPLPGATVALPLASVRVTFDRDMFADTATDPGSVLNPNNYHLQGDSVGPVPVQAVAYDPTTRTAVLSLNSLAADHYRLQVLTALRSSDGINLAQELDSDFTATADLSSLISLTFDLARSDRATGTVSFDVTLTNTSTHPLLLPVVLHLTPVNQFAGEPEGTQGRAPDGSWLIDLSGNLPVGGILEPGQSSLGRTITIDSSNGRPVAFDPGVSGVPAGNDAPVFVTEPVTTAAVG